MNPLWTYFVLAARNRNDDAGGWVQLLVVVIMAVIYGLGSILKKKAGAAQQSEESAGSPARNPSGPSGARKPPFSRPTTRPQALPPRQYRPQPRPAPRMTARPTTPSAPTPGPDRAPVAGPAAFEEARLERLPALAAFEPKKEPGPEPLSSLKVMGVPPQAEPAEQDYFSEILSLYDDPEQVRAAILHYEILGKPLSVRPVSERLHDV